MLTRRKVWLMVLIGTLLALAGATWVIADTAGPWSSSEGPTQEVPAAPGPTILGDDPDEDGYSGPLPLTGEPGQGSEEAGFESLPAAPAAAGLQPDDVGYAGPLPEAAPALAVPSESGETDAGPDWSQFFIEPQPDQDEGAVTGAEVDAAWSVFYYHHVAGTALRPRDSSMTWAYPGAGCMHQVAGSAGGIFNIHLNLPEGSRIDYLRLYYFDTSAANNSRAWVTTYDGAGDTTDLTGVDSAGTGGYSTTLSPYVGHVVNTATTSYVLNWRSNQLGSTMRLCGLRVAYRLPT